MAHTVNAEKWHFLPYITCGQVIAILKLKALEDRIIKKFPNSLYRITYPRALYTSVQDGSRALHVRDKKGDNRVAGQGINGSVQIPVFGCGVDGSTQQWHTPNAAISACQTIAWHSSYPWAWSTTQASRRWGQLAVLLYDHTGKPT